MKLLFVLITILSVTIALKKGVIELDEDTFGKIVDGSRNVLVQVAEYTWKCTDGYEDVAKEFKSNGDIIVAIISANDNKEFVKKTFDLESDTEPTVFFYTKDKEPKPQKLSTTEPQLLIEYTHFSVMPKLRELIKMVESFRSGNREGILKKAKRFVDKHELGDQLMAKTFLVTMRRIIDKGPEFVKKEVTRIEGLLKKKMKPEKVIEFKRRLTALESFKDIK
mmetsp:Transcript_19340/g.21519  ORF Transcript_19340/g.21519 Transcript_19340/m.21519 type:complete len:222 (+) Transcript_19340:40-705(+)